MTPEHLVGLLGAAALGAIVARLQTPSALSRAPERLMRTNVSGRSVPAVLGVPLVIGGVLPIVALLGNGLVSGRGLLPIVGVAGVVLLVLGAAGAWDDARGSELPRGFKGHLAAAGGGQLTGGLVKLLVGGLVGVIVGVALRDGTAALQSALLVPLTANLLNLTDRAPGRAAKVAILLGLPLLAFGHPGWGLAAAGTLGALVYLLGVDLAEAGMLGDMGANPVGGLIGLGLALSVPPGPRWAAIGVLVLLNALSERYSFSAVIAGNRVLDRIDRIGRRREDESANTSGQ